MNNIPLSLREEMAADPYYKVCARKSKACNGRITWEHAWIYAGKQIQEKWAIIPLCWYHHLGDGLHKEKNQAISLFRATPEDLAKYPKKDWEQSLKYFKEKYGKKQRTDQQNKAIHLYCQQVAEALNDSGLTIEQVLRNFTMELQWSKESVKEILWRTAQKRMLDKDSTTKLDKHQEITRVYEVINRFLAKLHVESIPFPSYTEGYINTAPLKSDKPSYSHD